VFWSRKRQAVAPELEARLAHLELELVKVQSEARQREAEQINLHDQVRKWMRRGQATERNQEGRETAAHPVAPAAPTPTRGLTGARARIAARRARQAEAAVNGADDGAAEE
jgi:hypothetical protein